MLRELGEDMTSLPELNDTPVSPGPDVDASEPDVVDASDDLGQDPVARMRQMLKEHRDAESAEATPIMHALHRCNPQEILQLSSRSPLVLADALAEMGLLSNTTHTRVRVLEKSVREKVNAGKVGALARWRSRGVQILNVYRTGLIEARDMEEGAEKIANLDQQVTQQMEELAGKLNDDLYVGQGIAV